jgi:hypothetical protein
VNQKKEINKRLQVHDRDKRVQESMGAEELKKDLTDQDVKPSDLIFACILCILTYLTQPKQFQHYYTPQREERNLSPIWINFLKRLRQNEGGYLLV